MDTLTFRWPSLHANNMVSPKSRPQGLWTLGDQMPKYFFTIRAGDEDTQSERAAELKDDAAALAYACEIVRELMHSLAFTDRSSLVKVRDETRPIVFSIPFLAACA